MALTLQIYSRQQVTVVVCQGVIVFGDEADSLRATVKDVLRGASSSSSVVLDLSNVMYVDSGGLGAMVGLLTSVRAAGGDLKLAGLTERVQRVLKTTHLDKVFHVHSTAEEAANTIHPGVAAGK